MSHLKFKHGEIALVPYPFVLTLYVEMKWFHENLSPGKWDAASVGGREEERGRGAMGRLVVPAHRALPPRQTAWFRAWWLCHSICVPSDKFLNLSVPAL